MVQMNKTHTPQREKDKFRKGCWLVLVSDTLFFRTPHPPPPPPLFFANSAFYQILNTPF